MKRLVISDLHIGTAHYNAKDLLEFLALNIEGFDEIILAGDIVDFIKVPLFSVFGLDILKSLAKAKRVIWIVGNHDISLKNLVGESITNIEFMDTYEFTENERKIRIEHGHVYDTGGMIRHHLCMNIVSVVQDFLERFFNIDLTTYWTDWNIKKRKLKRVWDILSWNNEDDTDVLILGHFHIPECIVWINENQEIKTYVNCGDWVSHKTYVTIIDGIVRLEKYEPNNSHEPRD